MAQYGTVTVNYSGLTVSQLAYIEPRLSVLFNDSGLQASIGGVRSPSTSCQAITVPGGRQALARSGGLNTNAPSIHFNLSLMNVDGSGNVSLLGKPFESTAVHETMHVVFPNLSGDSSSGHDVIAGDYLFRTATVDTI